MQQILTERIFESPLGCIYKSRLLLSGKRGNKTEYEEHTDCFCGRVSTCSNRQIAGDAPR
jgi:hypothetical protein